MRRLTGGFAGRTYHIVGNPMPRLKWRRQSEGQLYRHQQNDRVFSATAMDTCSANFLLTKVNMLAELKFAIDIKQT